MAWKPPSVGSRREIGPKVMRYAGFCVIRPSERASGTAGGRRGTSRFREKSSAANMNRNSLPRYLVLLSVLLLGACFQKFEAVRAVETERGIAFEALAIAAGSREGQVYELLDFTVVKRDCERDCTMWFIVREPDRASGETLEAGRIYYGLAPGGMAVRTPAKTLGPGSYSISATVQQRDASGGFLKSLSLDGTLSIRRDEPATPQASRDVQTGAKR